MSGPRGYKVRTCASSLLPLTLEEHGAMSVLFAMLYRGGGATSADALWVARHFGTYRKKAAALIATLVGKEIIESDGEFITSVLYDRWQRLGRRSASPPALKAEITGRDGSRCRYCGTIDGPFHLDHVFPYSRGGKTEAENLVLACQPCNLSKGDKTPEEWLS